jgi:hypothetical protein
MTYTPTVVLLCIHPKEDDMTADFFEGNLIETGREYHRVPMGMENFFDGEVVLFPLEDVVFLLEA